MHRPHPWCLSIYIKCWLGKNIKLYMCLHNGMVRSRGVKCCDLFAHSRYARSLKSIGGILADQPKCLLLDQPKRVLSLNVHKYPKQDEVICVCFINTQIPICRLDRVSIIAIFMDKPRPDPTRVTHSRVRWSALGSVECTKRHEYLILESASPLPMSTRWFELIEQFTCCAARPLHVAGLCIIYRS